MPLYMGMSTGQVRQRCEGSIRDFLQARLTPGRNVSEPTRSASELSPKLPLHRLRPPVAYKRRRASPPSEHPLTAPPPCICIVASPPSMAPPLLRLAAPPHLTPPHLAPRCRSSIHRRQSLPLCWRHSVGPPLRLVSQAISQSITQSVALSRPVPRSHLHQHQPHDDPGVLLRAARRHPGPPAHAHRSSALGQYPCHHHS
mmetsp:Transcript_59089/g.117435  ORF Transcript_59089/g.117435 Transcript_59089/m.117435 type:complete len:200 (-) Transcript_59089:498-1097(-)